MRGLLGERFELITQVIEDVFWIADRGFTRAIYVSPAYERIWGRSPEELYRDPQSFIDAVHPEDRELFQRAITDVSEDSVFEHDYRIVRADGTIRWIWGRRYTVRDGDELYLVGVSKDITDDKLTAERFRLISQATNDGIWEWDIATNTAWWSDSSYRIYGMDPAKTTPSYEQWMARLHPEDRERVIARFATVLASNERAWKDEYRLVRPDGTVVEVLDRAIVVHDAEGKPTRMIGGMMDITAQRALEGQLRHAQKMKAVGELAGGVAHDYNNMLQAALLELALLRQTPGMPAAAAPRLAELGAIVERASNLTRQLLVFSRREAMRPRRLDLNTSVVDLASMLRRVLGPAVGLHLELAPHALLVDADPTMLDQVVINLAVNARDAMRDGGRLAIATSVAGAFARIRVSDDGAGIAAEHLPHIFEPFFTTKDPGKGTGLGLAIVYGIVEQHGGRIEVTSEPGQGTTFDLLFPLVEGTVTASDPVEPIARGNESILLVEDDAVVRIAMRALLERAGYRVAEADRAATAIAAWDAADGRFDLVVSDLAMPGMSGRELAEHLTQRRADVKIIFMTGYASELLPEHHALLHKPIQPERLLGTIRASLDAS